MEKIKDVLYDLSDFLLTLIIILVIIIAITFVMTRTFDLDLQKESIFEFIKGDSPQPEPNVTIPATDEPVKTPTETGEAQTSIEPVLPTPTETTTPTETQTTEPTTSTAIEVTFDAGDTSDVFAEKLLSAGVITSADDFVSTLIERGLDTVLQPGTFNFKKGMSIDEVINVLTQ